MDKKEEHVYKSAGETFDFEDFFSSSSTLYDDLKEKPLLDESQQAIIIPNLEDYSDKKGATVLITSQQVITIPNIDSGIGEHERTQECIINVIFNKTENGYECCELREKAIRMSLGIIQGLKFIIINFPRSITKGQLNLLQAYQNTYGDIVERISRKYVQETNDNPIVLFGDYDIYCHSFEKAIEYAQTLPIVEEQELLTEYIIGQVISPEGSTLCNSNELKLLVTLNEEALAKGVTQEDCKGFWGYIRGLFQKIGRER